MELDFTKLNSIGEFNTAQEATKSPASHFAEKYIEINKDNGKYASEGIQQLQR